MAGDGVPRGWSVLTSSRDLVVSCLLDGGLLFLAARAPGRRGILVLARRPGGPWRHAFPSPLGEERRPWGPVLTVSAYVGLAGLPRHLVPEVEAVLFAPGLEEMADVLGS